MLVIFLNARGQLIFNGTLEKMDPPENVKYATCVNYGVCALVQDPSIFDTAYDHYQDGGSMDTLLPILAEQYETYHADNIEKAKSITDTTNVIYELKRQSTGFWTEKQIEYEKYLRFYPKPGIRMNCTPFAFMDGEEVNLDGCYSTNQRMKLSTFIQKVKERYPFPLDIYDAGCLKVLSNEEIIVSGVSEPDNTSRRDFGGRKRRKTTRTKRKTRRLK